MSQIYLGDKIIASTLGSDIKYDENTSVNDKIDEHATLIDEQNKNFVWKHYTTSTSTDCNIPSDFNELMVRINGDGMAYKWILIDSDLELDSQFFQGFNNTNSNYCFFRLSQSGISGINLTVNGKLSAHTINVYYR